MKRTFSAILFILTSLTFGTQAAIIENDTEFANSFKDTDTGLVWMDFGVTGNVGLTFDDVVGKLGVGGEFEGWQLPLTHQVMSLQNNLIDSSNIVWDTINNEYVGTVYSNTNFGSSEAFSWWNNFVPFIGANKTTVAGIAADYLSRGWFKGEDDIWGSFDISADLFDGAAYISIVTSYRCDNVCTPPTIENYPDWISDQYSTLLVRSNASVPEPSSLAILSLGLIGFAARRFRNNQRLN
jgi:hypothetical protein